MEHLERHLSEMSKSDKKSRDILQKMLDEEAEHGAEAKSRGSENLPTPVKLLMKVTAKSMTTLSRYL